MTHFVSEFEERTNLNKNFKRLSEKSMKIMNSIMISRHWYSHIRKIEKKHMIMNESMSSHELICDL